MKKPSFFIVVLILQLSTNTISLSKTVPKQTSDDDQEALIAFKSTITSDPFQVLSKNWSTNASICTWIGVSCTNPTPTTPLQRITALNFSRFSFRAVDLSPYLGNLTFLTSLDLSLNNFTGSIPRELSNLRRLRILRLSYNFLDGKIPEEIGNLYSLQMLDLKYNVLTGSIPYGIFNLSSVESIDLTGNSLSGELPGEGMCNNMVKLRGLYLSANLLSGRVPFDIYKCDELDDLSLSFNHFSGDIPRSIGWLTKVQRLFLGVNSFQGEIPPELRNLSRLHLLSLRGASVTGQIPSFIFNMTSLQRVDLSNNSLSGSFPVPEYINLPNLEELYLHSNQLTGYIPKHIANLTMLKYLSLANNDFTGELPGELGNLRIVNITARNNRLSGPIPPSIFNISTVEMLELSDNRFSGHLPSTIGLSLPNLKGLYLGDNRLSGQIPSSISNATSLIIISIEFNSLTGPVPDLGNLRLLKILLVGMNNLTGQYPNKELTFLSSLTNCRCLEYIEVSENQLDGFLPASIGNFSETLRVFRSFGSRLKGSIPNEIGNLTSLQDLYLDNNELTGVIPRTTGNLKNLVRVYLEHNKLEGEIPSEICELAGLGDFYVSGNALRGTIPACIGELKTLRRLYLDSNKLESNVPSSLYNLKDLLALNLSTNSLNGSVSSEIGNLKVVGELDLSWNQFMGDVPNDIGKAESLVLLSLAHNEFQGSIPSSLGNLRGLESLDLSLNNFSGLIPKSLEGLTFLKHFNVSYNRLEGQIPTGGNFSNFTAQSFSDNYGLCGAARLELPPCGNKTRSKINVKYIILPLSVAAAIFAVIMVFLLVKKRKTSDEVGPTGPMSSHHSWKGSSYRELQQATNGFSESNILGSGSFGSVFIGTLSDGLTIAVKVFNLQSEKVGKSFDTEIEVLGAIRHRNLIKIIGCCSNQDFKALVLEYMPNGSLEKWLYSHNLFLDLSQRLNIMIDVAFALEYLHTGHTFPIVHCDLKPSNVLLDEKMTARVGDFGIAKLFGEGELMAQTRTLATIGYMAPEYGAQGIVSTSGDIYSFGILLLEIFTQKKPTDEMFGDETSLKSYVSLSLQENKVTQVVDSNLLVRDEDKLYFSAKEQCVSSVLHLAMECLADSASERIGICEVVAKLEKIRTVFLQTRDELTDSYG